MNSQTSDPKIGGGGDGKNEQEEDESEGFQVVGAHPLHTELFVEKWFFNLNQKEIKILFATMIVRNRLPCWVLKPVRST